METKTRTINKKKSDIIMPSVKNLMSESYESKPEEVLIQISLSDFSDLFNSHSAFIIPDGYTVTGMCPTDKIYTIVSLKKKHEEPSVNVKEISKKKL